MDCAHEPCVCTSEVGMRRDDKLFCSDQCASGTPAGSLCYCGHAGCASKESGTAVDIEPL